MKYVTELILYTYSNYIYIILLLYLIPSVPVLNGITVIPPEIFHAKIRAGIQHP